jgi:hypothetical protein
MNKSLKCRPGFKTILLTFLAIIILMVPVVFAEGNGNFGRVDPLTTLPELNSSIATGNATVPPQYQSTPAPITVFKVEVTASSLPGPRDMAFGPSVIGLSIDPLTLVVVIIVILIAIAGYLYYRKNQDRKT